MFDLIAKRDSFIAPILLASETVTTTTTTARHRHSARRPMIIQQLSNPHLYYPAGSVLIAIFFIACFTAQPSAGAVPSGSSAAKWSNGVGLWGKRSVAAFTDDNVEQARFLSKRPEDSWNRLNSLWGKRSSWQAANGLWGKRSAPPMSAQSEAMRLDYLRSLLRPRIIY